VERERVLVFLEWDRVRELRLENGFGHPKG